VTDHVQGYAFDRAGHLLHLQSPALQRWVEKGMPGQWQRVVRDARIHLLDADVRYPIQANTFGLPPQVKAQALSDFLQAVSAPNRKPAHFEDWARSTFGRTLAEIFFEPYNRKLWTVPPSNLTLAWMKGYIPRPDVSRVLEGAFSDIPAGGGYNATFRYPRQGGIEWLPQTLATKIRRLSLQTPALRIDYRRRTVATQAELIPWKRLISTLALPDMVSLLKKPPQRILEAAGQLRSNSVLVVNLGVARTGLHPSHWVYFPEKEFPFYRAGFPSNYGQVAPPGCSALYAEVALPQGTGWNQRAALAKRVKAGLIRAGLLQARDRIQVEHLQYIHHAYVIYNQDHGPARKIILDFLEQHGMDSIGRWGGWEYSAMEDALQAGRTTAARALKDLEWKPRVLDRSAKRLARKA
jgi:protoporphyrinogen oxidase